MRAVLWGALGVGLLFAAAAAGVASLLGLGAARGRAGVKAVGEVGRAGGAGPQDVEAMAQVDLYIAAGGHVVAE